MTKPHILVGCPIYHRAWALPRWLDALEAEKKNADISLAFSLTRGGDKTEEIVRAVEKSGRFEKVLIESYTGTLPEGTDRDWSFEDRVRVVADKRNMVLDIAAKEEFDFLLMLDSDVFVPPGGLLQLIDVLKYEGFDAVCAKVWIWNVIFMAANYETGRVAFLNRKATGIRPVDIVTSAACLMASKVAKDPAVRYGVAVRGRDFGWAPGSEVNGWNASECIFWSRAAKAKGYRLAANCNVTFDHKMTVEH